MNKVLLKSVLGFAALSLSMGVSAQFTSDNAPQIGDINTMYIVDSAAANFAGITGADAVWDYQGLTNYGEVRTIDVVSPSAVSNGADFADADRVIRTEGLLDVFVSDDGSERVGHGLNYYDVTGDLVLELTNPGVYYSYPMELNDEITDEVSGTATVASLNATVPAEGVFHGVVDGVGTLILGDGVEYTNVFRYKSVDTITFELPQPLGTYQVITEQYEYYDHATSNLPIFVHAYLFLGPENGNPKREFNYVLSRDVAGFTANNAPSIGDYTNLYIVDSSTVDYDAINGDGAEWDYTDLADYDGAKKTIEVIDPSVTDQAGIFTAADRVIRTEDLIDVFVTETGSQRIGQGVVYHEEDGDLILNLDVQTGAYYNYPMGLNDAINENVEGHASVTFNGNTYNNIPAEGVFHNEIDGRGTIKLGASSDAQEYDVYRYKMVDTITLQFPGGIGEYTVINKQYEYYEVDGSSLPVFSHTYMKFGPTNGAPKREYTLVMSKDIDNDFVNELAPEIGDLTELFIVDSTVADMASTVGMDVVWNYTDLDNYDEETRTIQVVDPASTPEAALFPGADRVISTEGLMDAFVEETATERVGHGLVYHDDVDGDLILNLSADKASLYQYPMDLGDEITDAIAGTVQFELNGNTFNVPAAGTMHASIDGIGTLQLGSSVLPDLYENVYRYKLVDTIKMQVTSSIEYTIITTQYEYYDYAESNLPIFVHASLWMGPTGGAAKKEYSLVLSKNIVDPTLAVNEETLAENVNVYPNPTNNVVNINLPASYSNANVYVLDASGRILMTEMDVNGLVTMNVNDLAEGIYFVNIEANGSLITKKLIVQ